MTLNPSLKRKFQSCAFGPSLAQTLGAENQEEKMMKYITAILLSLSMTSASVDAETLKGGFGACISEDLFDQFVSAAVKKDERGLQYLLQNGCIITKAGIEVSVLDTTWSGKAKVRAYVGNSAMVLWTNIENVKKSSSADEPKKEHQPASTPPKSISKGAQNPTPLFDISIMVGMSIDKIRKTLGRPEDKQLDPTPQQKQLGIYEWSNGYSRDGQDLLITYDVQSRIVTNFFLGGANKEELMKRGNLSENSHTYRIEPVKALGNSSQITGIKVIPRAQR
jgi:hypothetical protein